MSIDPLPKKNRRSQPTKESPSLPQKKENRRSRYWIGSGVAGLLVLLSAIPFFFEEAPVTPPPTPVLNVPGTASGLQPSPNALIGVSIDPATAFPGTRLRAIVQPDSGSLSGELAYQWFRNDEPIDGACGVELDTAPFARNDAIALAVTHRAEGAEKESVRTIPVRLRNRPPVIAAGAFGQVINGNYVNQVSASDPDGDPVTFALEEAPPDMTIDAATGAISWPLPTGVRGDYSFQVVVSDGTSAALRQMKISLGGTP